MQTKEEATKKADDQNKLKGSLKGYDCIKCLNRGYLTIAKYDELEGGYVLESRDCECLKTRETLSNITRSGLNRKSFDDYIVSENWQKEHKEKALKYCSDNSGAWFIMCGQSGSGKTLLSTIIANRLLEQGKKVQYISWQDFVSEIKRKNQTGEIEEAERMMNAVKKSEILFIDELLKIYNETDLRYYNEIINYRYNNNFQTIITTEKDLKSLLKIDEATASRIIEKANDFLIVVNKDTNKNYRIKNHRR